MTQRHCSFSRLSALLADTVGLEFDFSDMFGGSRAPHLERMVFVGVIFWCGEYWASFLGTDENPSPEYLPDPCWARESEVLRWLERQGVNRGAPRAKGVGSDLTLVRHDY